MGREHFYQSYVFAVRFQTFSQTVYGREIKTEELLKRCVHKA
jgi:hypothetical protein